MLIFISFSNENDVLEDFGGSMTPGIRAIEASKITLATFGAIMGAFGVSVWLLERSRRLSGGPGEPPKGGGSISDPGKAERARGGSISGLGKTERAKPREG